MWFFLRNFMQDLDLCQDFMQHFFGTPSMHVETLYVVQEDGDHSCSLNIFLNMGRDHGKLFVPLYTYRYFLSRNTSSDLPTSTIFPYLVRFFN